MRKLAYVGIIILVLMVVLITLAAINYGGFRDWAYAGIQGSMLMPIHDFVVNTWIGIGAAGFTWIAAASVGIGILGIIVGVGFFYAIVWQKLIQQKLLHKTAQGAAGGGFQSAPTTTIPITGLQNAPTNIPPPAPKEEKPKE